VGTAKRHPVPIDVERSLRPHAHIDSRKGFDRASGGAERGYALRRGDYTLTGFKPKDVIIFTFLRFLNMSLSITIKSIILSPFTINENVLICKAFKSQTFG